MANHLSIGKNMTDDSTQHLLQDSRLLTDCIETKTVQNEVLAGETTGDEGLRFKSSAVLFPLVQCAHHGRGAVETCLILNKRSRFVRQPGDLCLPGGSFMLPLDRLIGLMLEFPRTPLWRWSHRRRWSDMHPTQVPLLKLLLATGLREAWEEMRLNPWRLRFLGPLPAQHLVLFDRTIHPLAVWVDSLRSCRANWEVERLIFIPLRRLVNPNRYGRFRPMARASANLPGRHLHKGYFPCFVHQDVVGRELLWGATLRVVQQFLTSILGFVPPPTDVLPIVRGTLDGTYPHGQPRTNRRLLRHDQGPGKALHRLFDML